MDGYTDVWLVGSLLDLDMKFMDDFTKRSISCHELAQLFIV